MLCISYIADRNNESANGGGSNSCGSKGRYTGESGVSSNDSYESDNRRLRAKDKNSACSGGDSRYSW